MKILKDKNLAVVVGGAMPEDADQDFYNYETALLQTTNEIRIEFERRRNVEPHDFFDNRAYRAGVGLGRHCTIL